MRTGFLQFDVNRDRETNIERIRNLISGLDCYIVVLPELSSCGYLFDDREHLRAFAERVPDGAFVQKMKELSNVKQCAIIAGLAEFHQHSSEQRHPSTDGCFLCFHSYLLTVKKMTCG